MSDNNFFLYLCNMRLQYQWTPNYHFVPLYPLSLPLNNTYQLTY